LIDPSSGIRIEEEQRIKKLLEFSFYSNCVFLRSRKKEGAQSLDKGEFLL